MRSENCDGAGARQALLHYAEKVSVQSESNNQYPLRTLSCPVSQCLFFDIEGDVNHTWPSSSLLNGTSHYQIKYQSGVHLVMSDNRLLIVYLDRHFFCPPYSSSVRDAHIQPCGREQSLLVVGLASGIHVMLLHEESPPKVLDDVFLETPQSVEKMVSLEDNRLILCYGNTHVGICRLATHNSQKLEAVLTLKQGPRRFLDALASLWDAKRYKDCAYCSTNRSLLVLSNVDLTLWMSTSTGDLTAVSSVAVYESSVAVLPGFGISGCAMLVHSDGGRQPVIFEGSTAAGSGVVAANIKLAQRRPLPSDLHFDSVQYACQSATGAVLLYDSRARVVVVITSGSPIYEGVCDEVEIASTSPVSDLVVGLACTGESIKGCTSFVVYGRSGILCRIGVRSLGLVTADLLERQGSNGKILISLLNLGGKRGIEAVVGACEVGIPVGTLSPLLNEFMRPTFDGCALRMAPGVEGLVTIVYRRIIEAGKLWSSHFSWDLAVNLESVSRCLGECHRILELLLLPNGWLDCPMQQEHVAWQGLVATSSQQFTMRSALNSQAFFLNVLLKGLKDAHSICKLYAILLVELGEEASAFVASIAGQICLERVVWGNDTRAVITSLCMNILECSQGEVVTLLESQKDALPVEAQRAVRIHALIMKGDAEVALSYACENIKSLRKEGLWEYVEGKLDAAFPDYMVPLRLLICWLRHDKSSIEAFLTALERWTAGRSPDQVKQQLRLVMQSVLSDAILLRNVVNWILGHTLEDDRLMCFAEILEEHPLGFEDPRTLPALFYSCWRDRLRNPQVAARGFGDIARSKQRVLLSVRIRCANLALEYASKGVDRLTYVLLLLQEELVKIVEGALQSFEQDISSRSWRERATCHVDELRYFYLMERRLFELAGIYKKYGGAKVQMDILKVHPETPERVTMEVLHDLLVNLVHERGMPAVDAVRSVVREYHGGYASGLPLLPFALFLAHNGEKPETIVEVLLCSGVPAAVVFDAFLRCLDERCDGITFTTGGVVTALAAAVVNMSGEGRGVYVTYLLERVHKFLESEQRFAVLREDDVKQLQQAEKLLHPAFLSSRNQA
uniref:Uncharacterized protein TCIL3000_11_10270 n=1 Tax=Trypanosoma congolense (strain IL3000) TaxID=1068625 RepID=G0V1N4_TRYCI|nr:unnamed protein product [Trypanosoma congolense IL3000]